MSTRNFKKSDWLFRRLGTKKHWQIKTTRIFVCIVYVTWITEIVFFYRHAIRSRLWGSIIALQKSGKPRQIVYLRTRLESFSVLCIEDNRSVIKLRLCGYKLWGLIIYDASLDKTNTVSKSNFLKTLSKKKNFKIIFLNPVNATRYYLNVVSTSFER